MYGCNHSVGSISSQPMSPARKTTQKLDVRLRREPTMARGQDTFEHILAVAAELLDEVGPQKFTTNLLAKRAGLGLQAVYRYFPNKHAVVTTLSKRMVDEWDSWFATLDDDIDECIVRHMTSEFLKAHKIDLTSDATAIQRLHGVAEQVKIDLGLRTRSAIKVDEISYGDGA